MSRQLPPDFVNNMKTLLGDEWEDFSKSLELPEKTSIRFHPFRQNQSFHGTKIDWEPLGVLLDERPSFALDPNWHAGAYYVQESSSMFLGEIIRQLNLEEKPINILDLCAAPGGKSTHLLSLIHKESLLVSNEILPKRNKILVENIERWGMPNVIVTQNEAADFRRVPEFFDVMVVDAPCSGEGLFRRQAEAIDEWSKENVDHCSIRQKSILEDVAPTLKVGGILIYSTCTFNPSENENIIQSLLDSGNWKLIPIKNRFDNNIHSPAEGSIPGTYHFYPHKVPGSGFYIAALEKTSSVQVPNNKRFWPSEFKSVKTKPEALEGFINQEISLSLLSRKEQLFLVSPVHESTVKLLENVLKITHAGISAGQINKGIFTPAHGLSMSLVLNPNISKIEFNKEESLAFLRKETLYKDDCKPGWNLATYQGNALGWLKVLPNRFNNYLPVSLMLRQK